MILRDCSARLRIRKYASFFLCESFKHAGKIRGNVTAEAIKTVLILHSTRPKCKVYSITLCVTMKIHWPLQVSELTCSLKYRRLPDHSQGLLLFLPKFYCSVRVGAIPMSSTGRSYIRKWKDNWDRTLGIASESGPTISYRTQGVVSC